MEQPSKNNIIIIKYIKNKYIIDINILVFINLYFYILYEYNSMNNIQFLIKNNK